MYYWLLEGKLVTIEQVGEYFKGRWSLWTCELPGLTTAVPVNLKNEEGFHITIEEYLQALVSLTEELSRLAVNAVTLGDYERPLEISKFVKVQPLTS